MPVTKRQLEVQQKRPFDTRIFLGRDPKCGGGLVVRGSQVSTTARCINCGVIGSVYWWGTQNLSSVNSTPYIAHWRG